MFVRPASSRRLCFVPFSSAPSPTRSFAVLKRGLVYLDSRNATRLRAGGRTGGRSKPSDSRLALHVCGALPQARGAALPRASRRTRSTTHNNSVRASCGESLKYVKLQSFGSVVSASLLVPASHNYNLRSLPTFLRLHRSLHSLPFE